jgi:hypothetical protein
MAVKFTLKGRDLEVSCTLGANLSGPTLNYRQGSAARSFAPEQVHVDDTSLGQMVTVTLDLVVDAAGPTTFSLFLPALDVPMSDSIDFTTIGLYKEFRGPMIVAKRQITEWRSVHLYGVAQTVLVPS